MTRNPTKVITGQNIVETIDRQTGEMTKEVRDTTIKVKVEEDYIKLYLRAISVIHGMNPKLGPVLNEMLRRTTYDNRIVIAKSIKKRMAANIDIKVNTFEHHLSDICKAKLLIKEDTNVYLVNTYVFGRGRWKEILQHRESLGFEVEFKDDGHGKTEVIFNK